MLVEIILPVAAYFFGSFPYMLLLSRALGHDLSAESDYHIAMYRNVGRVAGFSGILMDMLKGIIPVLIGFYFNLHPAIVAATAVTATCGQMWPIFQKFNGEKGNTTGAGALGSLLVAYGAWPVFVVAIAFFVSGFCIRTIPRFMATETGHQRLSFGGPVSNSMPIGMLLGFASMPVSAAIFGQPLELILAPLLIFIGIVIRRLTASVRKDIAQGKSSTGRILINRLFLDRGYF